MKNGLSACMVWSSDKVTTSHQSIFSGFESQTWCHSCYGLRLLNIGLLLSMTKTTAQGSFDHAQNKPIKHVGE